MTTRSTGTAATLLFMMACAPGAAQGQAAGDAVEVPLSAPHGRLQVPVFGPGGEELRFLLSTASPVTLLSESAARRLGDGRALTLGGRPVAGDVEVVADARLTADGRTFDGLVGSGALNGFDVLVDLPGGRLVLKPFGRSVSWEGVALSPPVPLRIYHGVILGLDVELNGTRYPAMLDLGQTDIQVNRRVLSDAGIDGDGGPGTLRVGGATVAGAPVRLSEQPIVERFSPDGAGFVLVGAPLALGCPISLSWIHRELRTCVR